MNALDPPAPCESRLERSSLLADPRHRCILSLLDGEAGTMTLRDLAVHLAARERDVHPSAVSPADRRPILLALHHRHLPALASVGWVDRVAEGLVALARRPFADARISLPPLDDHEARWDAIVAVIARPRRVSLVETLADVGGAVSLGALADRLSTPDATVDPVTLHHVDLPRLAAVDLLAYDAPGRLVRPTAALGAVATRLGLD